MGFPKYYDLWKTLIEFYSPIESFIKLTGSFVSVVIYIFSWLIQKKKPEGIRMIWEAVKSPSNYGRYFGSFLFFFSLSYLSYRYISFWPVEYVSLTIIGILSLCLGIVIPSIPVAVELKKSELEREKIIAYRVKENLLEETLYKLKESLACVLHASRFWLTEGKAHFDQGDGVPMRSETRFVYSVPDFIHEILGIPEEKRLTEKSYYSFNRQLTTSNHSNDWAEPDQKYRPSPDEILNAFPAFPKFIENILQPYVEPLSCPIKTVNDRYIDHILKLINFLENKEFDEAEIERKAYNTISADLNSNL